MCVCVCVWEWMGLGDLVTWGLGLLVGWVGKGGDGASFQSKSKSDPEYFHDGMVVAVVAM